ncbi:hypothetical protein AMECASPLE_007823 [Ameca splendens]|uniref:Uncharacterized protein n=1 Tax=Ameca splendens TaxID=208324 RepID=A0ABV0XZN7_9TELE
MTTYTPPKAKVCEPRLEKSDCRDLGCVSVCMCVCVCVCIVLATLSQCFRWCWSSQVCWGTGATYSADCLEEYFSRRLPALRCQSVLPSVVTSSANAKSMLCLSIWNNFVYVPSQTKNLNFGFISLNN